MSQETEFPYLVEYNKFIKDFSIGQVTGEEVGEVIVRMVSYFAEYNLKLVLAERALSLAAKENSEITDESNGKQISVAKAEILTEATDEASSARELKCHKENCENFINALKSLQRGIMNEYAHTGL